MEIILKHFIVTQCHKNKSTLNIVLLTGYKIAFVQRPFKYNKQIIITGIYY